MIGGSADLTGSNNTRTKSMKAMSAADYSGRFIHYGIREHGMAAAMNGMALHRRHHPVLRHVPGVLRLLPAVDPARRADGRARHPRHDARLHRPRRGRPDAPAGRASGGAARDPEPAACSAPATRSRRWSAGSLRSKRATRPSVLALTRQNLPQLRRTLDERQPVRRRRLRDLAGRRQGRGLDLRHRLGGLDRGRGAEAARRAGRRGARRLGAVLRAVPGAARRGTAAP